MAPNLNSIITKLLKELADSYRKEYSDEKLLDMAAVTAKKLQFIPSERLQEVFNKVTEISKYFPDDNKLLQAWYTIKGSERGDGYYDSWGIWIKKGAFYTWMSRPQSEWIIDQNLSEWELRIKHELNILSDEDIDDWIVITHKKYPTIKGQIQKERHMWGIDDHSFHNTFCDDFNNIREKYKKMQERFKKEVVV